MTILGLALSALVVAAIAVGSSMFMLAASFVALMSAAVSPLTGMIAVAFAAPFPRPLVIPPPGLFAAMIGAVLLGVVLRLPIERPAFRAPSPPVLLLGAFMLYVTAQFTVGRIDGPSGPRGDEVASLFATIMTGVLAFIVASVVLRGRSPYPILTALLLSAALASGIAIAQLIGAEGLFGQLAAPNALRYRMTGPFEDPNYFGAYLAATTTLAVACAVVAKSRWLTVSLLGLAGFFSVALLLTLSRGALLALATGLAAVAFSRSRRAGLITVAATLLLGVGSLPIFIESRFGADSDLAAGLPSMLDDSARIGPWLESGEVFLSSPLFGVGWGRVVEETPSAMAAHNWYLAILAETGIAGLVLWALFIASIVLALRRMPPSARTVGYSVLAAWMAASMFVEVPVAYPATGPVLVALAAALWADWAPRRREQMAATSSMPQEWARPAYASQYGAQADRGR